MRQKLTAAAVLLLIPSLGYGAGFALFETGARSFAMGGAFTAVADDPAALYWNPAGIAFQIDKGNQIMFGATLIFPEQDFFGDDPFPGNGYFTSQKDQIFFPPHFYFVAPLNESTSFGLSVLSPFGLGTYWDDDHLGRFMSKRATLTTIDISPNLAFKLSERLSFGLGVDYRVSSIDLTQNVGLVDPFTGALVDVGQAHIFTEGMGNDGWGWHAGFLAKVGAGFAVGATYHSKVKIDYEGKASFTQYGTGNPLLDALVAASLPFDQNVDGTTAIEYPDSYNAGLSWSNEKWTLSGQYSWFGWSSFQELELVFNGFPELDTTLVENYEDVDKYQFGIEYRSSPTWAFQGGYEYDNTPQPTNTMTPLLGDGDRSVYSFGVSWKGKSFWIDASYQYIELQTRSTGGNSESGYDGRYEGVANLFAASLGFLF